MRVLVLSPLMPGVGGSGGQTREFHLLHRLVQRGSHVVVCCPVPLGQRELLGPAREAGLDVRAALRPASRIQEVATALSRRPRLATASVAMPWQPWLLELLWSTMRPEVERAWTEQVPDAVLVVWDLAAAWLAHLPEPVPVVLDLHDVSPVYLRARAELTHGAAAMALRLEARRLSAFARQWLPRYDAVACVSNDEAARLDRVVSGVCVEVVPNGVDLSALSPTAEHDGPPCVLFTGTMNYPPNAEAADWLVRAIWPRVRQTHEDARLLIVGRHPRAAMRALDGRDGITVTGAVPDVQPYFNAAHVVAVPILSGGGTRLKMLEAAAAGRPIVSTRRGADGLNLRPGHDFVLADTAAHFADELSHLLGDARRRRLLATAARQAVERHYGWPALGDRLATTLERIADRRHARPARSD